MEPSESQRSLRHSGQSPLEVEAPEGAQSWTRFSFLDEQLGPILQRSREGSEARQQFLTARDARQTREFGGTVARCGTLLFTEPTASMRSIEVNLTGTASRSSGSTAMLHKLAQMLRIARLVDLVLVGAVLFMSMSYFIAELVKCAIFYQPFLEIYQVGFAVAIPVISMLAIHVLITLGLWMVLGMVGGRSKSLVMYIIASALMSGMPAVLAIHEIGTSSPDYFEPVNGVFRGSSLFLGLALLMMGMVTKGPYIFSPLRSCGFAASILGTCGITMFQFWWIVRDGHRSFWGFWLGSLWVLLDGGMLWYEVKSDTDQEDIARRYQLDKMMDLAWIPLTRVGIDGLVHAWVQVNKFNWTPSEWTLGEWAAVIGNIVGILFLLVSVVFLCMARRRLYIAGKRNICRDMANNKVATLVNKLKCSEPSQIESRERLKFAREFMRGVSLETIRRTMGKTYQSNSSEPWHTKFKQWLGNQRKDRLIQLERAFDLDHKDAVGGDNLTSSLSKAKLYESQAVSLALCTAFVSHTWSACPKTRALQLHEVLEACYGIYGDQAIRTASLWIDKFSSPQTGLAFKQCSRFGFFFTEYLALCEKCFVLLSPNYFERLWCRYEYVTFLAMHKLDNIFIGVTSFLANGYSWDEYETSLRQSNCCTAKCAVESDRLILAEQINANFTSHEECDSLIRFSAIALVAREFLGTHRSKQHWLLAVETFPKVVALARDLDFGELAVRLEDCWHCLQQMMRATKFCGKNPPGDLRKAFAEKLFAHSIKPLLAEKQDTSMKADSPLRKLHGDTEMLSFLRFSAA